MLDDFPNFRGLGQGDYDVEHFSFLSGVGADCIYIGDAAGHAGEDALGDFIRVVGDNPDGFFAVEAGDDFVGDLRGYEDAEQGIHGSFYFKEKGCNDHNTDIEEKAEKTHVDAVVFAKNGSEDVGATGGAIDPKNHAAGQAEEDAAVDGGKHRIFDDFPIPKEVEHINGEGGEEHPAKGVPDVSPIQ